YAYDWTKKDLLWVREYNSSSSYYLTTYSYDLSANLLSVTDAKNQKTTYQYDDLNRLIVTKYPDGTNQTVTYDSVGNVISRLDPAGHTITYAYDQLNMLSNVTYPNAAKVLYTYDLAGNTLSVSGNAQSATSSSSTTFIYDARNRVTSETDKIGGTSYTTSYYYDKASNVVAMNYPDSYNLTYSYDFLNRVVNVGSSGSVASFKYTVDSKISSISYYNGVVTTYSYDKRDRPTLILSKKGTTTLQSLSYAYDAVGNVISVNSPSYNYTYDNLNRLNYTSGPWGKITYAYDAVGNRVKMVYGSVTTTYLYSSYNRLTQENTSSWTATLTYDKNGNLKKIVNGSTSWNYYYDYENHLTGVSKNGANVQNSTYDAQGRRIEQNVSGATVAYVYQGSNNIIYEKNLSSGVVTKHYYADGMQVGELSGSTSYYLQQDSIGSTRLATTSTGAIQFSSDYLPFGPEYNPSGSGIYFLFTGKLIDPVTGLYYFGARYYDPESGRFISEDTNPGDVKDPMSENRYIYARDNPLSLVDPTGHMFILPALNYQVYVPPSTQSCGYFGCGTGTQVYGPPQPPTTVTTPGVSSVDSCSFSSAGCQSTSTNLPSHTMDYYQWLDTVFLPQHLGEIVTDSIAVVIAFLGPIALAYLGGSNGVMEAVAASISSELALDEANLANDLNSGNVGGLVAEIGNIAGTAAVSLLHTLSPIELMGLAVAETGLSIGTGGLIDAVDWLAGTAALATTLTGLWEESITDFNNQN
ncbi:MAG TPA: RHS repeat-associated core domain-containing protein, partial [Nitrososphaerales archaeon]|nr:RHS repeat-associated core domain-containing protein [Nitrososphaerales archaeon]